MTNFQLLIVENNILILGELKTAFELKGHQVTSVRSGAHAFRMLSSNFFDLILLDMEIADSDCFELLKNIRRDCPELLIVVKTWHATLESALVALKSGVDDYLIEPLEIFEIVSAIENVLQKKRIQLIRNQKIQRLIEAVKSLEVGQAYHDITDTLNPVEEKKPSPAITFDISNRQFVLLDPPMGIEMKVELTSHEFDLLAYMVQFPDRVLSSRELALNTLGYTNISEKEAKGIIRPHISRLRKKIEKNPNHPDYIRTIRGRGYVFTTRK
jgi:DNA-binding response OmpR family regulator